MSLFHSVKLDFHSSLDSTFLVFHILFKLTVLLGRHFDTLQLLVSSQSKPSHPEKFLLVSHIHNLVSPTPLVCASPLDRWKRFTPHFYSLSSFSVCEQLVLARHSLDYGTLIDSH